MLETDPEPTNYRISGGKDGIRTTNCVIGPASLSGRHNSSHLQRLKKTYQLHSDIKYQTSVNINYKITASQDFMYFLCISIASVSQNYLNISIICANRNATGYLVYNIIIIQVIPKVFQTCISILINNKKDPTSITNILVTT